MIHTLPVIRIQSAKNQSWVATECFVAESFFSRFRGLIGTRELQEGKGLLLNPCNDIHMWFMSIPIDVVFIRKEIGTHGKSVVRVCSTRENIQPWKALPVRDGRASETLELPVGTIRRCEIREGDELWLS